MRAAGRAETADLLLSLALLLRAELRGAKALGAVGGFKAAKRSRTRIWAGATYVHFTGLTPRFNSFYEGLKVKRFGLPEFEGGSASSFLKDLLEAVSKNDEGVDASVKTELGRLFSALRFRCRSSTRGPPRGSHSPAQWPRICVCGSFGSDVQWNPPGGVRAKSYEFRCLQSGLLG